MQKLVKRMTRFIVSLSFEEALATLKTFLVNMGYTLRTNTTGLVSNWTTDLADEYFEHSIFFFLGYDHYYRSAIGVQVECNSYESSNAH